MPFTVEEWQLPLRLVRQYGTVIVCLVLSSVQITPLPACESGLVPQCESSRFGEQAERGRAHESDGECHYLNGTGRAATP